MTNAAGSGHPGGSLSAADIMTALYFHVMRHDPKNPEWRNRDRFVASKGHSAPALYATLAECGYFPRVELLALRKISGRLQGHPCMRKVNGVDMSTGSLGQGLSAAIGMATVARLDGLDYRVYVLVGDGESQEGQIWEAAMAAAKLKISNLTVFLDRNGLQIDGNTEDIMPLEPLDEKWKAFGWNVLQVNGHCIKSIINAVEKAKKCSDSPTIIIADTTKGRGVSFMENSLNFHGKAPTDEEMEKALDELEGWCGDDEDGLVIEMSPEGDSRSGAKAKTGECTDPDSGGA
jgi:transketolase